MQTTYKKLCIECNTVFDYEDELFNPQKQSVECPKCHKINELSKNNADIKVSIDKLHEMSIKLYDFAERYSLIRDSFDKWYKLLKIVKVYDGSECVIYKPLTKSDYIHIQPLDRFLEKEKDYKDSNKQIYKFLTLNELLEYKMIEVESISDENTNITLENFEGIVTNITNEGIINSVLAKINQTTDWVIFKEF